MPHRALLSRIRAEFLEMPGLRLTVAQAQRLWGVEDEVCRAALAALVAERFLCIKPNGSYARTIDGSPDTGTRLTERASHAHRRAS